MGIPSSIKPRILVKTNSTNDTIRLKSSFRFKFFIFIEKRHKHTHLIEGYQFTAIMIVASSKKGVSL